MVNMRAIMFGTGSAEKGKDCIICKYEIEPSEACTKHFGGECPDCGGAIDFTTQEPKPTPPRNPRKYQLPFTPPTTPGQRHVQHQQQVHPEPDNVWNIPYPFKEPGPETPYFQCTFQRPEGLMELISSGQASIQTLTGSQVWDLHLSPTDKRQALRLSSTLAGFSRVFHHKPDQPRDESTLILTHSNINNESLSSLKSSSHDASTPASPKAELHDLTKMVDTFRRTTNDAALASAGGGQWVAPTTTCGIVDIDGRKAKVVTGMLWLRPGEENRYKGKFRPR